MMPLYHNRSLVQWEWRFIVAVHLPAITLMIPAILRLLEDDEQDSNARGEFDQIHSVDSTT